MVEARRKSRSWTAFVAGFVFVLQTFAVAWTTGAMAAAPQLDAFGNPLCITSGDHDQGVPAGDHSKLVECCTFGCSAPWTTVADAPDGVTLWRPLVAADQVFHASPVARAEAAEHRPHSPRAPPLTV